MSTETEKAKVSTEIARIREGAGLPAEQWPDQRILTVRSMCAPKAQNAHQLAAFLQTCERYGLDPVQKEAWLDEIKGRMCVIVGRDGYLKIAGRDPDYRGFDAAVVREGDEYSVERDEEGNVRVHHKKTGMDTGKIVGAYALVHRDGRQPVFYEALWDELSHLHGRDTYKQHPSQMVLTRALTFALKLAYNISGVYSPADIGDDEGPPGDAGGASIEDLNARVKAKAGANGGGKPDPEPELEENVVEAEVVEEEDDGEGPDHEVVEEDAGSAEVSDAEADASGGGTPAGPDDEEEESEEPEPDQEEQVGQRTGKPRSELNKAYFATLAEKAPELYESPAQRKLWQEQKVGKASCKSWEADDFELALLLLERGQTDVVVPEPTDGSVPV